jgi:hypothetical protein
MPAAHAPERALLGRIEGEENADQNDIGEAEHQFLRPGDIAGMDQAEQGGIDQNGQPDAMARGDQAHQPAPKHQLLGRALNDESGHQPGKRYQTGDGQAPGLFDLIPAQRPDDRHHRGQKAEAEAIAAQEAGRKAGIEPDRGGRAALEQPDPAEDEQRRPGKTGDQYIAHPDPAGRRGVRPDQAEKYTGYHTEKLTGQPEGKHQHDRRQRPCPPMTRLPRCINILSCHDTPDAPGSNPNRSNPNRSNPNRSNPSRSNLTRPYVGPGQSKAQPARGRAQAAFQS